MKRLYFVRHGLSEMNITGHYTGSTETPLTPEGHKQAKLAGEKARELKIDYIVSSPLSRAHDTAKVIAKEIGFPQDKIEINPLFTERHFGAFEGKKWSIDIDLDGTTDAETTDSLIQRTNKALKYLRTIDAENILVVSHGSFGRAMRHHLDKKWPYTSIATEENRIHNAQVARWI